MSIKAEYDNLKLAKKEYTLFKDDTVYWRGKLQKQKDFASDRMRMIDSKIGKIEVELVGLKEKTERGEDELALSAGRLSELSEFMGKIGSEISKLTSKICKIQADVDKKQKAFNDRDEEKRKVEVRMAVLDKEVAKGHKEVRAVKKYSYFLFYFLLIIINIITYYNN